MHVDSDGLCNSRRHVEAGELLSHRGNTAYELNRWKWTAATLPESERACLVKSFEDCVFRLVLKPDDAL